MFRAGTKFEQIAGLYIFDRKLRLLVLDAIERIEVAVRTAITYRIAHIYGSFGHADSSNFLPGFDHQAFMGQLEKEERRSRERFVCHFRKQYAEETHLPVWMATELLSFGTMSRLYKGLPKCLQQQIAKEYGIDSRILASWLHALSHVRNVCAHHKRLWNRQFGIKPRLPSRSLTWAREVPDNGRLYCVLVVLQQMLHVASPNCHWRKRLCDLLDSHPAISLDEMRFPAGWRGQEIWKG